MGQSFLWSLTKRKKVHKFFSPIMEGPFLLKDLIAHMVDLAMLEAHISENIVFQVLMLDSANLQGGQGNKDRVMVMENKPTFINDKSQKQLSIRQPVSVTGLIYYKNRIPRNLSIEPSIIVNYIKAGFRTCRHPGPLTLAALFSWYIDGSSAALPAAHLVALMSSASALATSLTAFIRTT